MLKIRMRRMGSDPFDRSTAIVVSDSRRTPRAAALDEVGHYNPISEPPQLEIDGERVDHWVGNGAQLSPTVKRLLKSQRRAAS